MHSTFVHLSGSKRGRSEIFDRNLIPIGTAPGCALSFSAVNDPGVSPHHAQIRFENCEFLLTNLGSATGTFVNGRQVGEVILQNGDIIEVGQGGPKLRFRVRPEELAACTPSRVILSDSRALARASPAGHVGGATAFVTYLARAVFREASWKVKAVGLGLALPRGIPRRPRRGSRGPLQRPTFHRASSGRSSKKTQWTSSPSWKRWVGKSSFAPTPHGDIWLTCDHIRSPRLLGGALRPPSEPPPGNGGAGEARARSGTPRRSTVLSLRFGLSPTGSYDAETTLGGSGRPILSLSGRVIGVNHAAVRGFGGSTFGIPIRFGPALLAQVRRAVKQDVRVVLPGLLENLPEHQLPPGLLGQENLGRCQVAVRRGEIEPLSHGAGHALEGRAAFQQGVVDGLLLARGNDPEAVEGAPVGPQSTRRMGCWLSSRRAAASELQVVVFEVPPLWLATEMTRAHAVALVSCL